MGFWKLAVFAAGVLFACSGEGFSSDFSSGGSSGIAGASHAGASQTKGGTSSSAGQSSGGKSAAGAQASGGSSGTVAAGGTLSPGGMNAGGVSSLGGSASGAGGERPAVWHVTCGECSAACEPFGWQGHCEDAPKDCQCFSSPAEACDPFDPYEAHGEFLACPTGSNCWGRGCDPPGPVAIGESCAGAGLWCASGTCAVDYQSGTDARCRAFCHLDAPGDCDCQQYSGLENIGLCY